MAVELPESLQQEVAALQEEFKKTGADVKWVEAANLHLTLKFLGAIAEDRLRALQEGLRSAVSGTRPFPFRVEGIGAFPKTTFPRVLWLGVGEGKDQLEKLAGAVEETCKRLGFPAEERPFFAHLTIGRVRATQGLAPLVKKLQVAEFAVSSPAEANGLTLFQSALSPHGPTYSVIAQIPF
ncbi:MAG: RNA 2',3'-cyclic phosphodiesterase [Candidatus Omnitrophica bacterium]|nr:RNA 2',3'-cyclic phosphodiesterase [Candidatus Omnitrophota bacterium]